MERYIHPCLSMAEEGFVNGFFEAIPQTIITIRENGLKKDVGPGAPLTYFNDGGGPKDFFGSDILAKRDFFGSMKDAGIFWGRENNRGIFWGIVFFISSNQK